MGRFDKYYVDLKSLKDNALELTFELDNKFFADIEGEEFQKGSIKACVTVKKSREVFDFTFSLNGKVVVACDRCLDDLDIEVCTENSLKVKFGDNYADEGDIVIVPESDGGVNVAWYLYEFIALALPMKRVHAPGKCNHEMTGRLKKHSCGNDADADDQETEESTIDPRWEALKGIKFDEDN